MHAVRAAPKRAWFSGARRARGAQGCCLLAMLRAQVTGWVNHVRAGSYLTIAWCSFLWLWGAFSFGASKRLRAPTRP